MEKTISPLHQHLADHGSMTRSNREVMRLHKRTGYSADHIFKVATGQRRCSRPMAVALAAASRNKAVTVESLLNSC